MNIATNLLGRRAESKLSGVVVEIVVVTWEPAAGGLVVIGEAPSGKLFRINGKDLLMLEDGVNR